MNEVQTAAPKAHAKLGASNSKRWLECPGSIALSEKAPPPRESGYAKEGTEAHEVFEFLLKNRENIFKANNVALKTRDPDMVKHAFNAVEYILRRAPEGAEILCETKVDLTFVAPGMFGTVDAAIVDLFGRLVVLDYKYGAGVLVEPEENSQMVYYALGIAHRYDFNFSEVEVVVIQPRAYHESGETTRSWVFSIDELKEWEEKFREGAKRTEDPFAELRAGDHCKFCPAQILCPEISNKALERAKIVFDDVRGVESMPAPRSVTPDALGVLLDAAGKIETWIEEVRAHALHLAERGAKIPGWKLVDKRSTRKWTDAGGIYMRAKKIFGDEAFTRPELLSPAQLEKTFSGAFVEKFIAENTTTKSSGVTLVPASDKRAEKNSIEAAFSVVDEPTGKEVLTMPEKKKRTKTKPVKKPAAKKTSKK